MTTKLLTRVVGVKKFEQKLSIGISAKDIEAENVLRTWKGIENHCALDITDVQKVKKRKIDLTSFHHPITSTAPEEGKENENVVGAWKDIEYHQALDIADVQKVKKQKTDLTSSHPPITSAAPGEGRKSQIVDDQLSQKRALRVEMLKHRFADTILRAEQHMLLAPGSKCNPVERKKLEKKYIKAKARLETQKRASEAASRMKAEAELKLRRQKEREAARIALDKVQKTVEFNDSLQATIELEFEKLFGAAFVAQFFGHPLSQDRVLDELEEGEILC